MRYCYIIISLFFSTFVMGQNPVKNEFVGVLHTSNQDVISYKINFNEFENGKIEGVSHTDFYGKNSTKSKIIGTYNSKENKLSFSEVGNISSKSTEDEKTFCYVHVENLKIRVVNDKRIVQGKFKGLYSSGKSCANGTIYLVGAELLEELKIDTDSLKKIDSLFRASKEASEIKVLKANEKIDLKWIGEKIELDVWDSYTEDNDMINIYFNDSLVVENLIITNRKKIIVIPFLENKGVIKILALNEGFSGTNTVNFILKNKTSPYPVISSLKKGEQVFIEFYR